MPNRFRKKNMILEDLPSSPVPNTLYPNVLSAEYFQAIQDNAFFNHLGYTQKPKESYGVMTLRLERGDIDEQGVPTSPTSVQEPPFTTPRSGDPSLVGQDEGRVFSGTRNVQINFDGTIEGFSFTGESTGKVEGIDSFTNANSYTVQLTIDQFVGVDFSGIAATNTNEELEQKNPLLNPGYPGLIFANRGIVTGIHLMTNRHDRPLRRTLRGRRTRQSFIGASVFEKGSTYFKVDVQRTAVFAEVAINAAGIALIVPVHDYQRSTDPAIGNTYPVYTPNTDPEPGRFLDQNNVPLFNQSGLVSYPRNMLRIAWYAKGV